MTRLLISSVFMCGDLQLRGGVFKTRNGEMTKWRNEEMVPKARGKVVKYQDFGRKKVCKVKPVAVHHNVTFVIDLKHVALKDLGADDNAAWQVSCPKQRFQFFVKMDILNLFVILRTTAKASSHFVVNMPIIKRPRKRGM